MQPNPYFAVPLGDFLFDARSALDHIAVAAVPNRRKPHASFPIFIIDPEQVHPEDPKGDADRRSRWDTATSGMKPETLAVVRAFQPYNAKKPAMYADVNFVPQDAIFAVFSAFNNADKHRKLVTTVSGLEPDFLTVMDRQTGAQPLRGLPSLDVGHLGQDGAVIANESAPVKVQAMGATVIAAGISQNERGPYRRLPDFMTNTVANARRLMDNLEPTL